MAHMHLALDFLYAVFTLLSLLSSEQVSAGETRYISTVSRGYLNAQSGSPYFECYRSAPDLDAVIETGRYVHTYNNDPIPPPDTVEVTNVGTPTSSTITRAVMITSNHYSYGVFYCASRYDGGWTVVPTIFLRSDATFRPLGGRFTKTVNAGDIGVSIDFLKITPISRDHNWRHNGTREGVDIFFKQTQNTSYIIPVSVQPSKGGVYELHYSGIRGEARAGLMRLIVRECPAGRHHTSPACLSPCPPCYNGGICDDKTGQCICPPGFMGDNCETGCGGNRYGRNCEYRCDYNTDDVTTCSGLQVCVPDPYGCSCTPGYTDLDCTTECSTGRFGASCTESCHCLSGECDRFTGRCTGRSTECLSGWRGVNCQECEIGKYGPDCNGNIVTTYIKTNEGIPSRVTCTLEGGQLASKADPVVTLYRKSGSQDYSQNNIAAISTIIGSEYSYNVTSSPSGEIFYCSMVDVNTYASSEINGDGSFALPSLSRDPIVEGVTNVSVTLTWTAWDELTDIGDPPIEGYDVYFREDAPNSPIQQVTSRMLDIQHTIQDLKPDTYYTFGVRVVRPGEGGEGPWRDVSERTHCSLTSMKVPTTPWPMTSRFNKRIVIITVIPLLALILVGVVVVLVVKSRRPRAQPHHTGAPGENESAYIDPHIYEKTQDGAYTELQLKGHPGMPVDEDYLEPIGVTTITGHQASGEMSESKQSSLTMATVGVKTSTNAFTVAIEEQPYGNQKIVDQCAKWRKT